MSVIDIIIVVVFVGAIIYGLYKGIIAQLGSLGGILLGILACRLWGDDVADLIAGILPAATSDAQTAAYVNSIIANVLLFLVVYLLVKLLAGAIKKLTHALALGIIDRILGAIFGLFKWFLVFSIILNVYNVFFPVGETLKSSEIANGLAAKTIMDLAPTLFGSIASM
ncbi:MAG: CvpA family protein [Muribaculaceae bacterium]|nr:CvpA family protein [Muribaculaceae bacterium]